MSDPNLAIHSSRRGSRQPPQVTGSHCVSPQPTNYQNRRFNPPRRFRAEAGAGVANATGSARIRVGFGKFGMRRDIIHARTQSEGTINSRRNSNRPVRWQQNRRPQPASEIIKSSQRCCGSKTPTSLAFGRNCPNATTAGSTNNQLNPFPVRPDRSVKPAPNNNRPTKENRPSKRVAAKAENRSIHPATGRAERP